MLAEAEPLTDIASHGFPSSRRRRFERLRQPPGGYLATGDAICSFNPIYGQGMTCAAMEAVELGRLLDRHVTASGALVRAFYRVAAQVVNTPWRFAVGADFAFPATVGRRPTNIPLLNRYTIRLQSVAKVDPVVRRTFTWVQHLVTPPRALFTPAIVARVMRGGPN